MNIYHITYSPDVKIANLHFWGCNLQCHACLLKKEIYDCHLAETKDNLLSPSGKSVHEPEAFLELDEVMRLLGKLEVKMVVLMGAEATTDRQLPNLTRALHQQFGCRNILLTNGLVFPDLEHIDEVVFSLKARDDRLHRHYTGKSNKKILENFVKYHNSGIRLGAESVFIPDYIGYPEIEAIARFIAGVDRDIPYRVDSYVPTGDTPWRRSTSEEIETAAGIAGKHLNHVTRILGNEELKFEVLRIV